MSETLGTVELVPCAVCSTTAREVIMSNMVGCYCDKCGTGISVLVEVREDNCQAVKNQLRQAWNKLQGIRIS